MFMISSPISIDDPSDLIPSIWDINFFSIDSNTRVLSPLLIVDVGILKPSIANAELKTNGAIEATDKYLLTTFAMVFFGSL